MIDTQIRKKSRPHINQEGAFAGTSLEQSNQAIRRQSVSQEMRSVQESELAARRPSSDLNTMMRNLNNRVYSQGSNSEAESTI